MLSRIYILKNYCFIIQYKEHEEIYSQLQLSQINCYCSTSAALCMTTHCKIIHLGFIDQDQDISIFL